MAKNKKPKRTVCPSCGADLERYGLVYDCVHRIELYREADGTLVVRADRDLQGGTYLCGCCGGVISSSSLAEVDGAIWQNA